jgi:hypothetical protein
VNRRRQIDALKIFNDKYVGNDLIQTGFFSFFSDFLEVA